ncbi:Hypothetical protein A7982_03595 [Minicystis rosea]|nr:Hypothetical protein A7982_03595 [Minicystis rosea]
MDLDLAWIAEVTRAHRARRDRRVQDLWSGYGEIVRVALDDAEAPSVIVKHVRPPPRPNDASHTRKCRSYAVEATFLRDYASRCDDTCRVPRLLALRGEPNTSQWLFVLEDLDAAGFPGRTHHPNTAELTACLAWLASFHARFLGVTPAGLWPNGTYWHLATRRTELAAIDDTSLREAAPELDRRLSAATFQTFVHGDAKPANFCFSQGTSVAAVDFQYVGGGCGMKDVAYLLDGEEPRAEAQLLDTYFSCLRAELTRRPDIDAVALEHEWRTLYPIACADYLRFLAGWAKHHFLRDARARARLASVLRTL